MGTQNTTIHPILIPWANILIKRAPWKNVYVDISLTTHPPHIDKRRHFTNHPTTPSCLLSYWMPPFSVFNFLQRVVTYFSCIFETSGRITDFKKGKAHAIWLPSKKGCSFCYYQGSGMSEFWRFVWKKTPLVIEIWKSMFVLFTIYFYYKLTPNL